MRNHSSNNKVDLVLNFYKLKIFHGVIMHIAFFFSPNLIFITALLVHLILYDRRQQQTRLRHRRWQREENEENKLINHELPCRFEPSTHVGWHVDPPDELFSGKKK